MTINQVKEKLRTASIVDKFIYINLLVFIIAALTGSFNHLQQNSSNFMLSLFAFDASASNLFLKPHTFITYGFLHLDFLHILFNLIALYYIGNIFISYFSERQFIIYYLLGSVFGAILFLASFHYFPVFSAKSGKLIGASAGVSAIFVGLAAFIPNYEINLRFIGYVKLWILALIFVFFSTIMIRNGNEGGQIAHLGGALIGFVLTRFVMNTNTSKSVKKTNSNLKTIYSAKNKSNDFGMSNHQKSLVKQRKIDGLLDKISKSGYESLTKKERDFLASVNEN